MITRRAAPLLALLALSTCDAEATEDGACETSDEPASVAIDNRSGGVIDSVTATPCGGGEAQTLPLPEGGIAFSDQVTVALPAPGCWLLAWDGNGCTNDPPYRTSTDVCGGDTYAWMPSIDGRVCDAGGW